MCESSTGSVRYCGPWQSGEVIDREPGLTATAPAGSWVHLTAGSSCGSADRAVLSGFALGLPSDGSGLNALSRMLTRVVCRIDFIEVTNWRCLAIAGVASAYWALTIPGAV